MEAARGLLRLGLLAAFSAALPAQAPTVAHRIYWEELNKKKPEPLVDVSKIRSTEDWTAAGERAFREAFLSTYTNRFGMTAERANVLPRGV
jgi:hypothetical protein